MIDRCNNVSRGPSGSGLQGRRRRRLRGLMSTCVVLCALASTGCWEDIRRGYGEAIGATLWNVPLTAATLIGAYVALEPTISDLTDRLNNVLP